jgi:glycosyltransferase involved in cell wall biosynthesis
MKLTACLIIRNESANLERCLASIRPHVDEIVILDTGSTDDSPRIAKRYADKWEQWTGCNDSAGHITDFSAARNRNLAMATGDAVAWFDGDDEVLGGENLRKLASEAPRGPGGSFSVLAAYEYDHDEAGRVVTLQWRERIVGPPSRFEWRGPVHEGLLGKAGCDPAHSQTDKFRVVHRRRQSGKGGVGDRNLRILRAWFAANGEADVRLMHYFGAELLANKHIGEAMHWFRRHALMSNWSDERCLSLLHLARIHLAFGDGTEAARYATEAMTTKSWPEPFWIMGQAYCVLSEQGIDAEHNLRRGAHFLEHGLDMAESATLLMRDPTARFEAHAWLSTARAKLGDGNGAIKHAELALAGAPQMADVRERLKAWQTERTQNEVRAGMVKLHELGALTREGGVAMEGILRGEFKVERERVNAPQEGSLAEMRKRWELEDVHAQERKRRQFKEPVSLPAADREARVKWGDGPAPLRIAFFLGHQLEPWTPETLERDGMGGSETMAWEMSKRLAKLGHQVAVYGHCDGAAVYKGVSWFDSSLFAEHAHHERDVLIVSRQAAAVTLPHSAAARVLWVHDVHVGPDFTPDIAIKYDFIWCLSNWHREFFLHTYPWLPPRKVEVTRNGIDPDRFRRSDERAVPRNPHRAIYSSSPDRGLAEAVAAWPAVRARVPDAELHCYYGFDNWDRTLELCGDSPHPPCSRAARDALKAAIERTEGVVMRGRVNGKQLAEAMLGAGVWAYSTWFSETSCITAMEAQAAGLRCVAPPLAALAETVHPSARTWTGDFVADVISAMSLPPLQIQVPFDLDSLAREWQDRLNNLASDAAKNVVQKFVEAAE